VEQLEAGYPHIEFGRLWSEDLDKNSIFLNFDRASVMQSELNSALGFYKTDILSYRLNIHCIRLDSNDRYCSAIKFHCSMKCSCRQNLPVPSTFIDEHIVKQLEGSSC
jgi:hypothetical protein